jgi:Domain of unknown function (DUF4177)
MQRVEYKVLRTRGMASRWHDDEQLLGDFEEMERILNEYAAAGWELFSHTCTESGYHFLILERPFEPREVLPAAIPEGRGDEISPAE